MTGGLMLEAGKTSMTGEAKELEKAQPRDER